MRCPLPLFVTEDNLSLAVDLYELTMAAAYFHEGLDCEATFELFVRKLPPRRGFLVVAGLEQALHYLSTLHFTDDAIAFLRRHPSFAHVPGDFFEFLSTLRFRGTVHAMPEGTVAFAEEPLLRVTAPIIQAQIVETYLLSTIMVQTLIASKAARVVLAAGGRPVVDFGSRRAHGPQAGLLAARAAYIGGCIGTSNVLAARELKIPAIGTAAHSWTLAHDSEEEAFAAYCRTFPRDAVLLIDTYDTLEGARRAVRFKTALSGVRLDSGDLVALSRKVRQILDAAGLRSVRIIASGDLDEDKIARIVAANAPIDAFGVGTEMVTSRDEPVLPAVYKLVQIRQGGRVIPKAKWSEEKASYPLAKQVFRTWHPTTTREHNTPGAERSSREFCRDIIAAAEEALEGDPLLVEVMRDGQLTSTLPEVAAIRERAQVQIAALPAEVRRLENPAPYAVTYSARLLQARENLRP